MLASALVETAAQLRDEAARLDLVRGPVTHVYNPLAYAWERHRDYLERWAHRPQVVLVGMNPGPWGMAQTGVPFGDVVLVRDWLGICGPVDRPHPAHPKRPVLGFDCPRREVSGQRLWGWARARFGTPERFFEQCFVLNYCPLCFLEVSGRNRTPDQLPAADRERLYRVCDPALRAAIAALGASQVLGVGGFAAARAQAALAGLGIRLGQILHPSPASPRANRDWAGEVDASLKALGLLETG